ncbi:MAG: ATP cone domain-containing protein, partial [Kiritimatiellaeota bacterium]|nr:ATP cone domain-containing protein [Kiritimatiellota bacterium]
MAVKTRLDGFRKRDGLIVPFQREKITGAIRKATENVSRHGGVTAPADMPEQVTDHVLEQLSHPQSEYFVSPDEKGQRIAHLEDVQDLVEVVLAEMGHAAVVAAYKRYRKLRELAREHIRVRDANQGGRKDVTDASLLLVESVSTDETLPWDRTRIIKQLTEKIRMPAEVAASISKAVENHVIACGLKTVGTKLIRELVNNELAARGHRAELQDLSLYSVPRDYLDQLMFTKSVENSNIVNNNPEAVNLGIAELILKQWAMDTIFSPEVKHAHNTGAVHLHDLGYPHRVYCSSHSVEYVKKYGLTGLSNLNTESKPARSASVLTGQLNTFLASMQSNYAGALGLAYLNILYAPYLEGMDAKHLKQVAQELIFNGSQNAFSRGGQTLFLDFNIHSGVPSYLTPVPAVGPGGTYMLRRADGTKTKLLEVRREEKTPGGWQLMDLFIVEDGQQRLVLREVVDATTGVGYDKDVAAALAERGESIVTYGDYTEIAQNFSRALLEVWEDGDKNGRVFEFPKCDFHISEETFSDPAQYAIFLRACEVASRNGSTYFIFDRDAVTLSACCRLRTTIQDNYLLRHPESLRFCGFQNVTINIPQCAYTASRKGHKDLGGLLEEIDRMLNIAVQAHLQKKATITEMISEPGRPLWQIGKPACDGKPYVELDKCTYIIGLIGVNDAVQFLIGRQRHEDTAAMDMALKVVAHMFLRVREFTEKYGLKFSIEESPAESAARRLAKADLVFFPAEARGIVKGDSEDVAYYTNSIHLAPEAEVGLVERIREQSKFHSLIESGAIIHAFVGEEQPSPESIARLVRETFFRTQSAQLTISP